MNYTVQLKNPGKGDLSELVPGAVYINNYGKEILFVGYCSVTWDSDFYGVDTHENLNVWCYMDVEKLRKSLHKGVLSEDLRKYSGKGMLSTQFVHRKKRMKKFAYIMYPSDFFKRLEIQGRTKNCRMVIETIPGDYPDCVVKNQS